MRKLLIVLSAALLIGCKQEIKMQDAHLGHWVSKAYIDELKKIKSPKDVSVPLLEIVFEKNDSNLVVYYIGRDTYSGRYMPNEEGKIISSNFARSGQDYELNFNDSLLSLYNLVTHDKLDFIKINSTVFKEQENAFKYKSFAIPYVNNILISGTYANADSAVMFTEAGIIKGLEKFQTYSLCLTRDCLNASGSNVVYLANRRNEGLYYDFEFKNDSLIIYNVNEQAFLSNKKAERKDVMLALKKIN